jgi:hypothetical protein
MGRLEIEAGRGSDDRGWLNRSSRCIAGPQTLLNYHAYITPWTISYGMLGDVAGFAAGLWLSLRHRMNNCDAFDFTPAKYRLYQVETVRRFRSMCISCISLEFVPTPWVG